ncbi:hypothetical protein, partial [Microcoleus sp. FACHB-831]|uniref:hypothetical protein n=1 Tax=Microcoleus sp. FACHB-831 TaxID=2692827 RepID=UPI001A7E2CFA
MAFFWEGKGARAAANAFVKSRRDSPYTNIFQGVTTRLKRLLDKGYSSHAPLIKRLFIANGSEHCLDP